MDVTAHMVSTSLRRAGFQVVREGDQIRVRPWSVLTDEQRMALRQHKAAVLELLVCIDCGAELPHDHELRCPPCVDAAWRATYGTPPPAPTPRACPRGDLAASRPPSARGPDVRAR
jgi:hypothetical protein